MNLLPILQRAIRAGILAQGGQSRWAEIRGSPIHYYELKGSRAEASPLVLVHGLGGSANGFAKILHPLKRRFGSVVALDLPGHGFSPMPSQGSPSLSGQLEILAAFCQQWIRRPAFVVGNSLGGALCVLLASQFPQLVSALGLLAPAGAPMDELQISELSRAMRVTNTAEVKALTQRLFHRAPLLVLLLSRELRGLYDTAAVRALLAEASPARYLTPDVLGGLRVPILLLWGESEKLLPFDSVDYFRAHLPAGSRVEVVRGVGHVPHVERPREVVRRLTEFADEVRL